MEAGCGLAYVYEVEPGATGDDAADTVTPSDDGVTLDDGADDDDDDSGVSCRGEAGPAKPDVIWAGHDTYTWLPQAEPSPAAPPPAPDLPAELPGVQAKLARKPRRRRSAAAKRPADNGTGSLP
jgi:hypothetical protein